MGPQGLDVYSKLFDVISDLSCPSTREYSDRYPLGNDLKKPVFLQLEMPVASGISQEDWLVRGVVCASVLALSVG